MGYDLVFRTEVPERIQKAIEYYSNKNDSINAEYAEKYGDIFSLCGWCWSSVANAMKNDIGTLIKYEDDIKYDYDFTITVGNARKLACALAAFKNTDGSKKYETYLDVNNDAYGFAGYDPEFKTEFFNSLSDIERDNVCFIDMYKEKEMLDALLLAGDYGHDLYTLAKEDGWRIYNLIEFADMFGYVYTDAPDDEVIGVFQSF